MENENVEVQGFHVHGADKGHCFKAHVCLFPRLTCACFQGSRVPVFKAHVHTGLYKPLLPSLAARLMATGRGDYFSCANGHLTYDGYDLNYDELNRGLLRIYNELVYAPNLLRHY